MKRRVSGWTDGGWIHEQLMCQWTDGWIKGWLSGGRVGGWAADRVGEGGHS